MVDTNYKIRDYFRRKSKGNMKHDPTTELNFIPLWDKEFLYLLGLEDVVQFRLELLDKTVYNKPKTHKTKDKKKKKFPEPAVEPSTPPKDPLICAQCKTDFSCSWKQDINGLCLCQSCFKCNWRKENRSSHRTKETSTLDSSSSSASFSQSVNVDHWDEGEGAFSPSVSASAHFESSVQLVPRVSAFHTSPDNTSSSSLSSPSFYSDSSSCVYSPLSSDLLSSPFYVSLPLSSSPLSEDSSSHYNASSSDLYSSPFYVSSPLSSSPLSEDSSSHYNAFSSDLYSSWSSLSPSPPCSSALYSSKKVETPYWMETPLAKSLTKEKQEMEERKKPSTCYRPPHNQEKTEKMPICGSLSSASSSTLGLNQNDPQKAQAPNSGSKTSTPVVSARKQKFEPPKLMSSLKKMTKVKHSCKELMPHQANSPRLNQNPPLIRQTPITAYLSSQSTTSPQLLEPLEAQLKVDSRLLGQSQDIP